MRMIKRFPTFVALLTLCAIQGASAQSLSPPSLTTDQIEGALGREQDDEGNWVDRSHLYVGNRADDLAIYLDQFFGAPIEDLESADSTLRFTTRFRWDDDEGEDIKFRLRGNVHLPRISERLSLAFNAEDDDNRGGYNPDPDGDNAAALQLRASGRENRHSRFDFTLSASSGINLKPGIRYRFKNDFGERSRIRYVGRAAYSDKDRFHHKHNIDFDYLTSDRSLLRWANKVRFGDRSEGTEWASLLSWRYGYSLDSAVALVVGATGKTDPDVPEEIGEGTEWLSDPNGDGSLVTNYGVVVKFRNRLYKDWLYVEFEPGYTERQRNHYDERHGVFFGRINFEITFNRGREQGPIFKSKDQSAVAGVFP